ncbi:MAG: radical SAM protein [Anaerolineae bacterium]
MSTGYAEHQPFVLYDSTQPTVEQDCACAADAAPLALYSGMRAEGDTDCACAEAAMPVAFAPLPKWEALWKQAPGLYRAPLMREWQVFFNPGRPSGVVVLNRPAADVLETFHTPRPLADGASRAMARAGLVTPADAPQDPVCPSETPDTLTAWLHITSACNLRCVYCYAARDATAMDETIGRLAVDAVFRSARDHGFRAVKLKYAGGEPTLNFAVVRAVQRHARTQAARAGLALRATLLTNAVDLTDDVLAFVADSDVRLAVSLDLCPGAHDQQRPRQDGRATYAQVRRNVERAVRRGIVPHLSITITGTEDERCADTIRFALDMSLPFNLNFVRPVDEPISDTQVSRMVRSVRMAFAEIEATPPSHSLLAVLDRADFSRPHAYACGAGRAYLVVDPLGRISPCQMTMMRPVGDIRMPDPLAAVQEVFANVPVWERSTCVDCPWRYACGGGCPLLARRAQRNGASSPPFCAAYRTLYPELIRLEGLRLLHARRLC